MTESQQLFFLGGIAIAVGVFTYSRRVMMTVGTGIFQLSPVAASVVVWSHSAVLFVFSSEALEAWLLAHHLPSVPLVPVSSSQAIVGAVIGIGLLKGGKGINWKTVAGITSSWITTPIIALLICFISLFFLQNVFQQKTFIPVTYSLTQGAMERLTTAGIDSKPFEPLMWQSFPNGQKFNTAIHLVADLTNEQAKSIVETAEIFEIELSTEVLQDLQFEPYTQDQMVTLARLEGRTFQHKWEIKEALAELSDDFKYRPGDKAWNNNLNDFYQNLFRRLQN